ncbi:MAG TPA: glycosyltransferase family protein [Pyrinomonadaceae bacterium]|nr:glycosyltransferase family protein [Pyrinomonadaceae bacterium]
MRVVGIIQARTGSVRLPGKVLRKLAGEPMLAHVARRVQGARTLDEVVVATTTLPGDDAIAELCADGGISCFRGSENDLLDRYYRAALEYRGEAIVRVTADCPLIDSLIIDRVVDEFLEHQPDVEYASNIFPDRSYPRGLDTEIIRFDVLERVWRTDQNPAWREHVTSYIHRHPEAFSTRCVRGDADYSHLRWTVDTPQDFELVTRIYKEFSNDLFSWQEALELINCHPAWSEINRDVEQKAVV